MRSQSMNNEAAAVSNLHPHMFITNGTGVVHRVHANDTTCSNSTGFKWREVTAAQCLVFHLPACKLCWQGVGEYEAAIHNPRQ